MESTQSFRQGCVATQGSSEKAVATAPEMSFIRLVSKVTGSKFADRDKIEIISSAVEAMEARGIETFSREVTHAVLILFWKRIQQNIRNTQWSLAEDWCRLVLNTKLFENCSWSNRLKIMKKLIVCALNTGNTASAQQCLNEMSLQEALESHPEAWLLTYRLALEKGSDLPPFPRFSNPDAELQLLQLSTLEALRLKKTAAVRGWLGEFLKRTNPENEVDRPFNIDKYLFPLYALSIEMQENELDDSLVEMTSQLFGRGTMPTVQLPRSALRDAAMRLARDECHDGTTIPDTELEWLCRESYTLSLKLLMSPQTEHVVAILDIAEEFARIYSERSSSNNETVEKLSLFIPCLKVWVSDTNCAQLSCPPGGLGHLAMVSFNQALKFYANKEDEDFWQWVKRAFELVRMMKTAEGDHLAEMFQSRLDGLLS